MAAPPVIVAPTPTGTQPPPMAPPATKSGPVPETPPVTPSPAKPVHKPRRSAPAPSSPPDNAAPAAPALRPPAPLISPQFSPEDEATYRRKTNENIAAAEKNLQQANGRELNAAQHDLVEKINSFIGQAREAMRAFDWVRASNLAEKASVLSAELAHSF